MSKRKPKSADEFMRELEADPDHQAAQAKQESELAEQDERYAEAEAPLVQALAEVGVEVESVWDLVNTRDDYSEAIPVLEEHLKDESYPDRIREGIARALSFRKAAPAWPTIVDLYRSTTDSFDLQQGLAVAMAGTVTDETVDELVAEAGREEHGESRLLLLLGLKRLKSAAAKEALESFVDDPDLGGNATKQLKGW
jgi:Zn-dependent M32 family carboxypeptidase